MTNAVTVPSSRSQSVFSSPARRFDESDGTQGFVFLYITVVGPIHYSSGRITSAVSSEMLKTNFPGR